MGIPRNSRGHMDLTGSVRPVVWSVKVARAVYARQRHRAPVRGPFGAACRRRVHRSRDRAHPHQIFAFFLFGSH